MTPLLPAFTGTPQANKVYNCDALTLLRMLPDASVDLIATDWPYNIGKAEWDSWPTVQDYLDWMDSHLREMRRVLKPNGSYYGFAATELSAEVEVLTKRHLNVLNRIVWRKPPYSTKAEMFDKDIMRAYFPASEAIIFAEQYGSDEHASGEAGYVAAEQALKRQIFGEPIRLAMLETNTSTHELTEATGAYGTVNHGGAASNWLNGFNIPTPDQYQNIRDYLNGKGSKDYFPASNEDLRQLYEDMRIQFEELRQQYEDLRRPFNVSADVPYTDVWDFPTVAAYPGKHPCEKPLAMMRHIVNASSRPGDVVLDCFCGSGATVAAAFQLGRQYIGCDREAHWVQVAQNKCVAEFGGRRRQTVTALDDLPLFQKSA
jgi:adenine-specific DNA-methyltransferase